MVNYFQAGRYFGGARGDFGGKGDFGRVLLPATEALAVLNGADEGGAVALSANEFEDGVGVVGADGEDHSDAHVEDVIHFVFGDLAESLQPAESGRDSPAVTVEDHVDGFGKNSFGVFEETTTGDVGDTVHDVFDAIVTENGTEHLDVDEGWGEQDIANGKRVLRVLGEFWDR